ncbi:MAG: hypothetical protein A2057_02445 [Ignavibacteria bacterium GWA2_35_9]|nr:MAG: hypothetical protein A2057_02445 [Ignavibacteria bacterium GWA2_35_9]OGU49473.1 MAG: hypothetical protein A2080_08560 [Ignavibacteria bacterium GWC2_36_12]
MKKAISLFPFLFFITVCTQAATINIDVADFAFTPSDIVAQVGDTLIWTQSGGSHTTTSASVPGGASSWNYTFTGLGDTFTYIVSVPGDYTFICSNHPDQMTGTIRVADNVPLLENFDYTAADTLAKVSQWQNHSGTGTFFLVESGNLGYSGYPSSGVGNSIHVNGGSGSREDANRIFRVQSTDVYASLLVNVQTAATTADYFFHLAAIFPTSTFRGRVFIKDDGSGNLKFGISKGSSSEISFGPEDYLYNTTYLLVLKYEVVGDLSGTDDLIELYINPVLSDPEPSSADATSTDSASDNPVGGMALRQGSSAYSVQIDGIRIATSWNDIVPVELTSFTATYQNNGVLLKWTTATELNNLGFEVERKQINESWNKISFLQGNGTTTVPNYYSYFDCDLTSGKYQYRLKQVDLDGSYEYSNVIEVYVHPSISFELTQNYPNPFNPVTIIKYSLPQTGYVTLKVYNTIGEEVATLVSNVKEAGSYELEFDASGLNSGVYYYRLTGDNRMEVKKMLLLK